MDVLNELVLPWFRQVAGRLVPAKPKEERDWVLAPASDDASITLPPEMANGGESTTLGRICELGPKVWILCYLHCHAVVSSALTISHMWPSLLGPLVGVALLAFTAWATIYLGSGVLENVARRHVWLRLAENGLLLKPSSVGTAGHHLAKSLEYRMLVGGLLLMAAQLAVCSMQSMLGRHEAPADLSPSAFLASASALLILHKHWVATWRLPSAADILCGAGTDALGGAIDLDLVKQYRWVSECHVAHVCAGAPHGPMSFGALAALLKVDPPPLRVSTDWAAERMWAMRFMGIAPPVSVVVRGLRVREGAAFKAERDRVFSSRMAMWNSVFVGTVLGVHVALCCSRVFS